MAKKSKTTAQKLDRIAARTQGVKYTTALRDAESVTRTVVCALNQADGRRAARDHGIADRDLVWADVTAIHRLRGLIDFNVLVTGGFTQLPPDQVTEIWSLVHQRNRSRVPLDLPDEPPTTATLYRLPPQS